MPLFSVVIPTYNRRERLLRAVRSVLAQRTKDAEIVVVDDGSSDDSAEAVAALGPSVRVIRQRNQGPSVARTRGVAEASGRYVAFLDSDDHWFPWTLETFARAIDAHDAPAWLYGFGTVEGRGVVAEEEPLVARAFPHYSAAAAEDGLMPRPTGVCIAREAFLRSGGFRETMRVGEDLDLWFRIAEEGRFVLIEAPLLYAREEVQGESLGEDVSRSFAGLTELVAREHRGGYRGGAATAFVRRAIISRQFMYYARRYREQGERARAARIYLEVLRLQARSGFREAAFGGRRNRFLLTFPLFFASPALHRKLLGQRSDGTPARV